MVMKTKHPSKTKQWPARLLGLDPAIYEYCTPHFRTRTTGSVYRLIFTAFFSSLAVALGLVHSLSDNWAYLPLAFIPLFLLLYFYDQQLIVMPNS